MYFLSIVFLWCLIIQTFSRPSHILEDYDKEAKEDTYEDGNKSYSDDYLHIEQKSLPKQFSDNEPNNLQSEEASNLNKEEAGNRPEKDYLEDSDDSQANNEHISHNDISAGIDFKRTADYNKGLLIEYNGKQRKVVQNKKEYDQDDQFGYNEDDAHLKCNRMHRQNVATEVSDGKRFINSRDSVYRDRRQVKDTDPNESVDSDDISTRKSEVKTDEDEETAIRRHIKNLSKEEIDELLNTLSEDKRELLKNIIENSPDFITFNKREITKKAGPSEENSLVGNDQSDTSKIQSVSANIEADAAIFQTEQPESTKKESNEQMCPKSTEIINSSEKSEDKRMLGDSEDSKESLDTHQSEATIQPNVDSVPIASKNGKKREANSKSLINTETKEGNSEISNSLISDDLYCSENEDLPQLWNDVYHDNNNLDKREISLDDLNSIKSLEDSFPNTVDESNLQPGSDMIPLVRVKRTNIEKRDTNLMPNLKVPYFSNAIDNNEDDNDEGSEFQDDGFFDRRTNFGKSAEINRQGIDSAVSFNDMTLKHRDHDNEVVNFNQINKKSDTDSLGSDTDAVLSGVEGVDDNLMYSSGSRNKRNVDELNSLNNEDDNDNLKQRIVPRLVSENENNEISEPCNNSPYYQENDAFGSLPRNYDKDLGRFKRIRRLKPLNTIEKNVTNNI